jgi:2-hydroxy-3-oxopropionate reductase
MDTRIGFIGLGLMGAPMASNLLEAGFEIVAYNRSPGKAGALTARGAEIVDSAAAVAARAPVIITMLPDSPEVQEVLAAGGGVFEGAAPGSLAIDMSTIDPGVSRSLATAAEGRGLRMLDAPVSGGDVGARDGSLSIMVGGQVEDLDRARPIFDVLGSRVTHCGGAGAGQIVKACNQIVVAAGIEALAEAVVLSIRSGIDPERMLGALGGGLASSRVLEVKGPKLLARDFEPGFRSALHRKDLRIALEAADRLGVELPGTAMLAGLFDDLLESDRAGLDHSALLLALEDLERRD